MKLSQCFWDYNFKEDDLLALLNGKKQHVGHLNRDALLKRMLNTLSWYDFINYVPPKRFLKIVTPKFINGLKDKEIVQGLKFVRRLLQQ